MVRILLSIFAVLAVLVTPARAHEEPSPEQGVVRVIVEALAPSSYGDWAYAWGPVSARVSRHVHWHLYGPGEEDAQGDGLIRRNGWIDTAGNSTGVSAYGRAGRVTELSFELRDSYAVIVIEELRAAGVEVQFEGDDESASYYVVTPPGRDSARLTSMRVCTSPRAAVAQRCHEELTLAFETE